MRPRADLRTRSSYSPSVREKKILNEDRQICEKWKHDSDTADPANSTEK